jgi:hypothetical protein
LEKNLAKMKKTSEDELGEIIKEAEKCADRRVDFA